MCQLVRGRHGSERAIGVIDASAHAKQGGKTLARKMQTEKVALPS